MLPDTSTAVNASCARACDVRSLVHFRATRQLLPQGEEVSLVGRDDVAHLGVDHSMGL